MKKKILLVALIAMIGISSVFAAEFFQLGAVLQSPVTGPTNEDGSMIINKGPSIGLDTRLNVLSFNVTASALVGTSDQGDVISLETMFTPGIILEFGKVRLTAGLGPRVVYNFDKTLSYIDETTLGFNGSIVGAPLAYRFDIALNHDRMGIALSYSIDTQTSLRDFDLNGLGFAESSRLSIAVLWNVFD